MKIKIRLLSAEAKMPHRGSPEAAGYDLSALESVTIKPGQTVAVRTGLAIEIPRGYFAMFCPRGSLARRKELDVPHSVGIIDSDFRGEWLFVLRNLSPSRMVKIPAGERIGQAIFIKHATVQFIRAKKLSATKRGAGQLGSTGKY